MILLVSAYPDESAEAGGALQRVAVVDMALAGYSRAYLDISLKAHISPEWQEISPGVMVHRVNLFLHFWYILYLASKASMVYVHTLENALRVLPLYLSFPIVTDLSLPPAEGPAGLMRRFTRFVAVHRSKAVVVAAGAEPQDHRLRIFRASPQAASPDSKALAAFVTRGESETDED